MNAASKIEVPTGLALLRQPFPPHQISQLPKGGVMLDYVGHAALTDRLLDADPNWNWEPMALDADGLPKFDTLGGLWIKLTICGVTRPGYGDAGGKKGTNAIKEAIGDALRNAAMRFGAALDLWHKGELHADEAAEGHIQEGAVSPPPPATPKRNWGGRYPTKTALRQARTEHHQELERLAVEGTLDDLDGYLTSPEYKDYVQTASEHFPLWLEGNIPPEMAEVMPPEYVQTFRLEQKARDMIALRGNVPAYEEERV